MVENPLPEGVPGGHHAQHLPYYGLDARTLQAVGTGYPKSMMLKDANAHSTHQFVRPLQKVTNSYHYGEQSPMNLVQKETMVPDSYRYMNAPYLGGPFQYSPFFPGPFSQHYQPSPYTPPSKTAAHVKWPEPSIPVSSPLKTEVKSSPSEKTQFKIPTDGSRRQRYQPHKKPKERTVTLAAPIATLLPPEPERVENEDIVLENFSKSSWICKENDYGYKYVEQIPHERKVALIERRSLKKVVDATEEDIRTTFNNELYDLHEGSLIQIMEKEHDRAIFTIIDDRTGKMYIEMPVHFPLYVCGRDGGWASYSPCGKICRKLHENDRVLYLARKESASSPKKALTVVGSKLQNGHRESKVSPYKQNDLKNEPSNNSNSAFNCSRQPEGTKKCDTSNNDNNNSSQETETSKNKRRRWSAPDQLSEKCR